MAQNISFDVIARDHASRTLDRVGRSAGTSTGKLKALGKVGKVAALGLAAGVAAAGVVAVKFAKAAAADEQSSALMARQFKNSANATDAQVAATERWITAQGKALGVADDDLRPALSSLVVATHDVGKAQHLAALAMNVSAGKGVALAAVSKALAKGALGNTSALGRLGVATKDAHGKAKSFAQITAELGKQFAGEASTKANTLSGKVGRLKLILSETEESIGYKLIPVLTKMATWILNVGIPAVGKFGDWFKINVLPVLKNVGDFIAGRIIPTFQRFGTEQSKTGGLVRQFATTFSSAWGNVKSILNSAASIAQSFWGKYGDLITKYGIGTLKNLLTSVRGIMNIIAGIFKVVAAVLKGDWGGAWDGIKQITKGAVQVVRGSVGQLWNTIRTLFSAGARSLGPLMHAAWNGAVDAVRTGVARTLTFYKSLPGKMLKALGNLDNLLYNAGKAVIGGLIKGIGDKVGDLKDRLHSITKLIPLHKGPIDKDRKLLQPAGVAIMDGLIGAIEGRKFKLAAALERITSLISSARDKITALKQTKADFKSTFSADSIFGADSETTGGTLSGLLDFQKAQAAKARQLAADVARVTKLGLSGSLIKQLQSAGSSGEDQLHLLAGASSAQIKQLNALNAQTQSSLGAAGLRAGNAARGGSIDADIKRARKQERVLEAILHYLARQHGEDVVVKIGPDAIIRIIRKHAQDKGVSVASLLGIG